MFSLIALGTPMNFQDIVSLVGVTHDNFGAFKKALNIELDDRQFPKLSSPRDCESRKKAIMLMLLLWEQQTEKPTKHALIAKLKEHGFHSVAEKLKY